MLPKKLDNCLILAIQILQFSLYYVIEYGTRTYKTVQEKWPGWFNI